MRTKTEEPRISEMSLDPPDNANPQPNVMEQVEDLQTNLAGRFPSCTKTMVRSNVTHGFWLHLPMPFCKLHMPNLEDENGEEYKASYIAQRTALSAGWKAFSFNHKLVEGDVLVFHLVSSSKFKVYIVRAFEENRVDSSFVSLDANIHAKPIRSIRTKRTKRPSKKAKCLDLFPLDPPDDNVENNSLVVLDSNSEPFVDRKDRCSGLDDGIESLASVIDFKEVKSIGSFIVMVNGSRIDSELSEYHRTKYYELCSSQNSFLHDNLLKSITGKLAAEIIIETVSIAEAIRACKISTSRADYMLWDKTLKGFELLGMNVGFLRARLNRLDTLALELQEATDTEKYEASPEHTRMKEEKKSLELNLAKLKEAKRELDAEIEILKANAEKHELMFREKVTAAW
ncbi:putative AP2/B3-like transcriptional factor family protein [Hibiscus syriacus]|uniref:AP2/B3-like transcriptional factor family protein n=1 Tax=Hibiscus syriacus TaxID=106335 RepID=A0A6A2YEL9_HIBSY|nr:B3 domain-containing protein Os01g0234100-like [Hibiscus syriacus]XP_039035038.1 B3 domain-containing protein Os01g0234100-like [Hibiscus syriacus]KAE8672827.1 putative AP2/B3-like transcriptional factor family protein [Hibiscus syriacus]